MVTPRPGLQADMRRSAVIWSRRLSSWPLSFVIRGAKMCNAMSVLFCTFAYARTGYILCTYLDITAEIEDQWTTLATGGKTGEMQPNSLGSSMWFVLYPHTTRSLHVQSGEPKRDCRSADHSQVAWACIWTNLRRLICYTGTFIQLSGCTEYSCYGIPPKWRHNSLVG